MGYPAEAAVPDASAFGELGASLGLRIVNLSAGTGAAASNTSRIQAALDIGGRICVQLKGGGDAYATTFLPGSNTHLAVANDTRLRLAPGTNDNLIRNKNWNSTVKSVSGLTVAPDGTVVHRYVVTAACTAHGLAVGSYVLIKGDTTDQYVGVHRVEAVPNANSFQFWVNSGAALTDGVGTITAAAADYNLTLSGGRLDYNAAQNGGGGNALMMVIFNKVGKLHIHDLEILDVPKYGIYPCNVYGVVMERITVNTGSAAIQFIGPIRDVQISDVTGWGGDDVIAYVATNGGGYSAYDLPDCNGEIINFNCDRIRSRGGNNVVAVYPGAGYAYRGIRIRDLTADIAVSNFVTISTVSATNAALPQDILIDGLYGDCNGPCVVVGRGDDQGTIQNLSIRNIRPKRYKKNHYIAINNAWTIKTLKVSDVTALFDLSTQSCNLVNAVTATINFAEISSVSTDTINYTGFGARLVTGNGYAEISVHDCDLAGTGFVGIWDASSANVTPVIWARALRLSSIMSLQQSARPYKLRGWGIASHGTFGTGGMIHAYQAGVAYDIRLREIEIQANNLFSSTVGNITLSGDETVKADVTKVVRADGASFWNTNAAAGTLGAAGVIDCMGTAANSWRRRGDYSLQY